MSQRCIPVFDVGGVLLDFDAAYLYRPMFDNETEMTRFFDQVMTRDWWIENLDRGGRPYADAIADLAGRYPEHRNHIEAADYGWPRMIGGTIDGTVALLRSLKRAGLPIYAITNFPREKYRQASSMWPFLTLFDGVVVSGEEGMIKPEPEIYRLLLDRYRLKAEDCLFIDDSHDNIVAARGIGMHGHHFQGPEGLRDALKNHGLLA